MTLLRNLKQSAPWEWLVLLLAIICLAYALGALHGCAGMTTVWNTVSANGLRIAIAVAVAVVVAICLGAPAIPVAAGGAAASTATILAEPPQQVITKEGSPLMYGMPMWFWFVVGYVLSLAIRNRHWIPFFFSKQAKSYRLALLRHFIFGGKPPVIPPQFMQDTATP